MKFLRRILGYFVMIAGVIGLILSLAGLVGLWVAKPVFTTTIEFYNWYSHQQCRYQSKNIGNYLWCTRSNHWKCGCTLRYVGVTQLLWLLMIHNQSSPRSMSSWGKLFPNTIETATSSLATAESAAQSLESPHQIFWSVTGCSGCNTISKRCDAPSPRTI